MSQWVIYTQNLKDCDVLCCGLAEVAVFIVALDALLMPLDLLLVEAVFTEPLLIELWDLPLETDRWAKKAYQRGIFEKLESLCKWSFLRLTGGKDGVRRGENFVRQLGRLCLQDRGFHLQLNVRVSIAIDERKTFFLTYR